MPRSDSGPPGPQLVHVTTQPLRRVFPIRPRRSTAIASWRISGMEPSAPRASEPLRSANGPVLLLALRMSDRAPPLV